MKAVILDVDTLAAEDLNIGALKSQVEHWSLYGYTAEDEVADRIADADIVFSNKIKIDAEAMAAAKKLKLIAVMATGTNNIDLDAAKQQDILVCNARDYSTASVAQHTMAMILALSTNLIAYDRAVKQGEWQQQKLFCLLNHPIHDLAGKTLGLIGYGNMAKKVEQMALAFDMRVIVAQSLSADAELTEGRVPLDELLSRSDIVSLHCPLTEQSRDLLNAKNIAKMKPSALLINTARGGIVNETDLVVALRDKVIAGAGIDVLSQEPPTDDSPLIQAKLPNLLLSPHCAWGSQESRQRLVDQLTEIVKAFKAGQPIQVVS